MSACVGSRNMECFTYWSHEPEYPGIVFHNRRRRSVPSWVRSLHSAAMPARKRAGPSSEVVLPPEGELANIEP